MPPRAISRSSTYLPKTWGNTAQYLSATLGALGLFACGEEAQVEVQLIRAHYAQQCKPENDNGGAHAIELRALGDFDPSNASVVFVGEEDRERALAIPEQTKTIELRTVGPQAHWGIAQIAPVGPTDVTLWPTLRSCELLSQSDRTNLSESASIGIADERWLLSIGLNAAGRATGTRLFDLGAGREVDLGGARTARARSFASVTPLAAGFLVAGGTDLETGTVHDDAEVFDLETQRFQGSSSLIALGQARFRHASVSVTGSSVLLVGGANENGQPLDDLERVPANGNETEPLPRLVEARIEPLALRLDDDRIVVAGGHQLQNDVDPVPVSLLEWLNADASERLATLDLEDAALGRAFVAMVGAGLLAVGGCDAEGAPSAAVWWVDRDLEATRLPNLPSAAQGCNLHLIEATLGSPFLLSNGMLWRFDPWTTEFTSSDISLDPNANAVSRVVRADTGLMVWLREASDGARLLALRHDVRNPYSSDVTPFLLADSTRLSPTRPPSETASARYAEDHHLELTGNAELWITDTQYADFDLEMVVTGPAPLVLMGSAKLGGSGCRWPASEVSEGLLRARRRADQIELSIGQARRTCSVTEPQRVAVGLQGTGELTRIRQISISRGAL